MFRALNQPIFRSTRLCVAACGIMYPGCCWPVAWNLRFQASNRNDYQENFLGVKAAGA